MFKFFTHLVLSQKRAAIFRHGFIFSTQQRLVNNFVKSNAKLDIVAYNELMRVNLRSNEHIKKIADLYDEVIRNDIEPNVATFNILMEMWIKEGDINKVSGLYQQMLDKGIRPNSVTFSIVIPAQVISGKTDQALELLQKMISMEESLEHKSRIFYKLFQNLKGDLALTKNFLQGIVDHKINIDHKIYNDLINAYVKKPDLNGAFEIYNAFINQGGMIDVITFTNMIKAIIQADKAEEAMQFYYEVKQTGIQLDTQAYTIMLDTFVKMRRTAEAQRIFVEMRRSKVKPNVITYTSLITGLGQAYNYDGVRNVHNLVRMDLNVELDIGIYNALMDAYNRCGHIHQVLLIWDLLIIGELPIDNSTVSIILDSCGYGRVIHRILNIWKYLHDKKFPLNLNNYHSYIEALARNQLFDEAKNVLMNELKNKGFKPEAKTIRSLLNFLHDVPKKSRCEYEIIEWVRNEYPDLAKEMKFTERKSSKKGGD
ncbi:42059_t:CDS:1 [Gigaspora margarita]|uniref:42059_t:CDS:1 n=3 Tax=Gigaspora margarita TaxID=4874 RepID=A0ABN7UFL7_GIGMA|nr:TPR-like protein [Gigaspora margarita]CAG8584605.1 42059_t:CDS:1 [Gigaspora margarita]